MRAEELTCRADIDKLDEREKLVLSASPASSLQLLALQLAFNELCAQITRDWSREIIEADAALLAAGICDYEPHGEVRTLAERINELARKAEA